MTFIGDLGDGAGSNELGKLMGRDSKRYYKKLWSLYN